MEKRAYSLSLDTTNSQHLLLVQGWVTQQKAPKAPQPVAQQTMSKTAEFAKSHSGTGGSTSSLVHGKAPEKPKPPIAGAYKRCAEYCVSQTVVN